MKGLMLLVLMGLSVLVQAADPEVRVQARLVPAEGVRVGGTLSLEVDLLVDTWFTAAPVLPKLELPGAVVNPPGGEAQHLNEKLDGKTFFGLRYRYQITPQSAQRFTVPALAFQVQPGPASVPVTLRSEPLSFLAQGTGAAPGTRHLVASRLTFTQEVQRSHEPLRVGDSITRYLKIEARGAQAMLIPPPEFVEVKGLRRYVQTPKVQTLGDGRGGVDGGAREDAASYVIGEAGKLTLPAIELQWWDASSGEAHRASVPAVELEAVEAGYQAPFSITEDLHALGQNAAIRLSGHWLLLGAVLVLGVGLALFGRPWGRALLTAWRRRQANRKAAWLASADYGWQLARQQLAHDPARLDGLYLWVRRSTGQRTLSALCDALPGQSANRLLTFLRSRYATDQAAGQAPAQLIQALPDLKQAVQRRKTTAHVSDGLKPLNPDPAGPGKPL